MALLKRFSFATDEAKVESRPPQSSLLLDLVVGLYLLASAVVVLFSVGWYMAPFETDKTPVLVLVGLALVALTGAAMVARGVWRNHEAQARLPLVVSLACLTAWVVAVARF